MTAQDTEDSITGPQDSEMDTQTHDSNDSAVNMCKDQERTDSGQVMTDRMKEPISQTATREAESVLEEEEDVTVDEELLKSSVKREK